MSNHLVPIQITLQAANAADARTLVLDLAGTLGGMPASDVPARTEVSTVPAPLPAAASPSGAATPQGSVVPFTPLHAAPGAGAPAGYPPPAGYQAPPVQQQAGFAPPAAAPPAGVPVSAPTYTLDQLGAAAAPLLDAGRGPDLVGWLQQHGAGRLDQLNPQLYGEFATYLRSLGAQV